MHTVLLSVVTATALFIPSLAHADQCAWVTKDQAIAAARTLGASFGTRYLEYCEPCGDTAPTASMVKSVSFAWASGSYDGRTHFEVKVNGVGIDLAYAYTLIDSDGDGDDDTWGNVAARVGCDASGVSPQLDPASLPGGGKFDEAAEDYSDLSSQGGGCSTTGNESAGALALCALGMVLVRRRRATPA